MRRGSHHPGGTYWKTFTPKDDGGEIRTHLDGIGDSYTLCGMDTAGDDMVHGATPIKLPPGKHRVTCEHCIQIIVIVREHLKMKKST